MFFLSQLWIYPVKSLRGLCLSRARVEARGLEFDRRWMVVNPEGEMLTQRQFPRMAQIETALGDTLCLRHGSKWTEVAPAAGGRIKPVRVWRDQVRARDCGDKAAQFLSDALQTRARLVWMPDDCERPVDQAFADSAQITSFSDGFPFLLMGQSTLNDLNQRVAENGGQPVDMTRFRPNLVFEGGGPLAEEQWSEFWVGSAAFKIVKPCSRCVITTIDQETGEKRGPEPIFTLSSYRKLGAATYLGQNAVTTMQGEVRVGEKIRVETKTA